MDLHTKHWIVLTVFFGVPLLAALCIGLFDIWVFYAWGYEATISQAIKDIPPMLVFFIGFVLGP